MIEFYCRNHDSLTEFQFIEVLMPEADSFVVNELRIRRIHCEYLFLVANVILARGTDEIERSVSHIVHSN
jgi:hypothetical protein